MLETDVLFNIFSWNHDTLQSINITASKCLNGVFQIQDYMQVFIHDLGSLIKMR